MKSNSEQQNKESLRRMDDFIDKFSQLEPKLKELEQQDINTIFTTEISRMYKDHEQAKEVLKNPGLEKIHNVIEKTILEGLK